MTWSRFFDAYEPVHALVAESDGQLLGLVHYLFHRSTTAIAPELLSAGPVHAGSCRAEKASARR